MRSASLLPAIGLERINACKTVSFVRGVVMLTSTPHSSGKKATTLCAVHMAAVKRGSYWTPAFVVTTARTFASHL